MASSAKDARQRVRDAAFRLLGVRARSASELRERLQQKKLPDELIEETLTDFQQKGYQSDEEFARLFAREKFVNAVWGPKRVAQELRSKGIDADLAAQVLSEYNNQGTLLERIFPIAEKRWASTAKLPYQKRRQRLTGFLQRRGYDWQIVEQIFNKLGGQT
ncbi:regulatory protein RecX [Candidatus Neomarinimicrobiota bacterium]